MTILSYLLLITIQYIGVKANDPPSVTYGEIDAIPIIEVLAPRIVDGDNDTNNVVGGVTVFAESDDNAINDYRNARASLKSLSMLFSEYALYGIVILFTLIIGAIALTKFTKGHHIHIAHQHKHSQLHEYYLWRKAYLTKKEQDKLTRRS